MSVCVQNLCVGAGKDKMTQPSGSLLFSPLCRYALSPSLFTNPHTTTASHCCLCTRLVFAVGSHRDFALPFFHNLEGRDLSDRGYQIEDTGAQ